MLLSELIIGVEIEELNCPVNMDITDICDDSRKVKEGCLFVAVPGFETDGHKFIKDALSNGASVVVCDRKPPEDCSYILVSNTRVACAHLCANFFEKPSKKVKMIGVTGTNGKTTVTTLLKETVERITGKKAGLIGTVNNMIGSEVIEIERRTPTTPESRELQELIKRMADAGCEYVFMEVSSHSLAFSRVEGIQYSNAVFTNLTQDHLDYHRTMDNYLNAKMKLFKMCDTAAVNIDDTYAKRILTEFVSCPVITFGTSPGADIAAENIHLESDCVRFRCVYRNESADVRLAIPALFSVYNALAVIACCLNIGFGLEETVMALRECGGVIGRMEVVPTGGRDFTILIDYAVTPDAIENILKTVKALSKGRTVILFGCGGDRDKSKRPKMAEICAKLADSVIITSDNPRTEDPEQIIKDILVGMKDTKTPYKVLTDRREAIRWAIENAQPNDTIILAGKGQETYQIIGKTKYHMDEREIVAKLLQ